MFTIIGLLVVLAYFGQAVRLGGISSADEHAVLVLELVNVAAVLVVPMLLIAGADVADFGGELASGIAWSVRQSRRAVTLTCMIAAGALAAIVLDRGARVLWPALAAAPGLGGITLLAKAPQPVDSFPLTLMVLAPGPPVFNFRAPEACASGAKRLLSPPGTAGAA